MIVLCLQPSTPHPVFPIIPLHFYTHCAIPALQYLLSVCVCAHLCMWESPTRRTKVLMPFMEKARDSSFCYAWFVCLALGQSCRSPELFPFFGSCAHSPCVFVCVFKQRLHASGCLLCVCERVARVICVHEPVCWFECFWPRLNHRWNVSLLLLTLLFVSLGLILLLLCRSRIRPKHREN